MAVVIKGSGSIEGTSGLEMGANGTTEIRGQVNVALGSSVAGISTASGTVASGIATATTFSGKVDVATVGLTTSGTYTSFGTSTSVDISSLISTDVIRYDLMFTGVSCGGGTDWQFQLGDSGGVETSGYEVIAGYDGTNEGTTARTDAFRWTGTGDSSYIMDGRFTLIRIHGNKWWGEGHLVRTEAGSTLYYFRGSKELSAALTTIHISASSDDSESFDGGYFKLITYKGAV